MGAIRKFLVLPWREKALLVQVVVLLCSARIALAVLPFHLVRRALARVVRHGRDHQPPQAEVSRIVGLTTAAGRRLPSVGTCLTQALTAYILLGRRGYETKLRIGVTRNAAGKFTAHAWLENGDRIVIGQLGADQDRYTPFPALKGLEP